MVKLSLCDVSMRHYFIRHLFCHSVIGLFVILSYFGCENSKKTTHTYYDSLIFEFMMFQQNYFSKTHTQYNCANILHDCIINRILCTFDKELLNSFLSSSQRSGIVKME